MATITPTYTGETRPVGNNLLITGSFTGNTSDSHMVLVPSTAYVFSFNVATPTEDAATPFVLLNAQTGETAETAGSFGSVRVKTSGTGVYTFTAIVGGIT